MSLESGDSVAPLAAPSPTRHLPPCARTEYLVLRVILLEESGQIRIEARFLPMQRLEQRKTGQRGIDEGGFDFTLFASDAAETASTDQRQEHEDGGSERSERRYRRKNKGENVHNLWLSLAVNFNCIRNSAALQSDFEIPNSMALWQIRTAVRKCYHAARMLSEAEFLPDCIDFCFCGAIHLDHRGPGAGKAFSLPLSCGVDAHLGAVVGQAGGMIERIDRA